MYCCALAEVLWYLDFVHRVWHKIEWKFPQSTTKIVVHDIYAKWCTLRARRLETSIPYKLSAFLYKLHEWIHHLSQFSAQWGLAEQKRVVSWHVYSYRDQLNLYCSWFNCFHSSSPSANLAYYPVLPRHEVGVAADRAWGLREQEMASFQRARRHSSVPQLANESLRVGPENG